MDLPDSVLVSIEAPRWSFVKRDPQGRVDLVSPLPCPFNYGAVPGTISGDGDPLDAIVLGDRLPEGEERSWPVVGWVDFVDNGEEDPKLLCAVGRVRRRDRVAVRSFFAAYTRLKRFVWRRRAQESGWTGVRGIYWR